MKNKKADVATTLLVFMAIALAGAASIIFISDSGKLQAKITDARFLDKIYLKEGEINFYINEIFGNSVKGAEGDKSKIIENFTKELERYKINGNYVIPELNQLEGQINEEHISYDKENNIVTAEFTISLEDKVIVKEKKAEKSSFSASYTYNKKFEKEI